MTLSRGKLKSIVKSLSLVDDDFVEQVEEVIGMGHGAWDMEDPKEICLAVLSVAISKTKSVR